MGRGIDLYPDWRLPSGFGVVRGLLKRTLRGGRRGALGKKCVAVWALSPNPNVVVQKIGLLTKSEIASIIPPNCAAVIRAPP